MPPSSDGILWSENSHIPGVVTITINRPDRRNAIDAAAATGLAAMWRRFEESDAKVAVLVGAGDKAFSSGADLDVPPRDIPCLPGTSAPVTKPIISAVTGWCLDWG